MWEAEHSLLFSLEKAPGSMVRSPELTWSRKVAGGMPGDTGLRLGEGISPERLHEDLAEPGTESKAAAAPV